MLEVNLFTAQGEFVVTVIIPDFNPRPKAILWGERLFGFTLDDALEPRYEELFWIAANFDPPISKPNIANLTRMDANLSARPNPEEIIEMSVEDEQAAKERWRKRSAGYSPFISFRQFLREEKLNTSPDTTE